MKSRLLSYLSSVVNVENAILDFLSDLFICLFYFCGYGLTCVKMVIKGRVSELGNM